MQAARRDVPGWAHAAGAARPSLSAGNNVLRACRHGARSPRASSWRRNMQPTVRASSTRALVGRSSARRSGVQLAAAPTSSSSPRERSPRTTQATLAPRPAGVRACGEVWWPPPPGRIGRSASDERMNAWWFGHHHHRQQQQQQQHCSGPGTPPVRRRRRRRPYRTRASFSSPVPRGRARRGGGVEPGPGRAS